MYADRGLVDNTLEGAMTKKALAPINSKISSQTDG